MTTPTQDLEQLAEAAGISVHWRDALGRDQAVTPDVLRTMLAELGVQADTEAQVRDSLAGLRELDADTPSLQTALQGQPIELQVGHCPDDLSFQLVFEDGTRFEGQAERCGERAIRLPAIDLPGYHTLHLQGEDCTVAVAPQRCFSVSQALGRDGARAWALGVQLYSLRRAAAPAAQGGSAGFGDFTALARLAERAAERGASAVAVSPVHAMFSANPAHYSPYAPSSRLFLNVLYTDPAQVFGPQAIAAVAAKGLAPELARLEALTLIDWPAAGRAKLAVLRALYDDFPHNVDVRTYEEFLAFQRTGGKPLVDHARFEAIHAWRAATSGDLGGWRHWPAAFRSPDSTDVERFAASHAGEVRFHEFLQWVAARGLGHAHAAARRGGMAVGLVSDLAVGTDPAGSHAWSRQGEVLAGLSPGAPPDAYNARGQAWGLTAFSPRVLKAHGYRAFIEMLHASLAHAGGVRIDHALGLQRMWLVPSGAAPSEGAYVRYPFEDMLRLVALESWRYRAIVIGENLGTVPEGFNQRIDDAGMLGMDLLWFVRDGEWPGAPFRAPRYWSSHSLATTTTHDLPTVAGWWAGTDIKWRAHLGLLAEGTSAQSLQHERAQDRARLWEDLGHAGLAEPGSPPPDLAPVAAALGFVAQTPAPLVVAPLEDILALEEQPNLPGTVDTHPNWRRRLPVPVEDLFEAPGVAARALALARDRGPA